MLAREFHAREALAGGWSVRQLARQINSQFYERTALSKNKVAILVIGEKPKPEDAVSADEEIRNPLVLEFLILKDECSESDLEEALIRHNGPGEMSAAATMSTVADFGKRGEGREFPSAVSAACAY